MDQFKSFSQIIEDNPSWEENTFDLDHISRSFKNDDKAFGRWLKSKAFDGASINYAIMYHGTSSDLPIQEEGLKRTTAKTKKSIQSEPGFVYLSMYPDSAFLFGEISYPYHDPIVYAVRVPIRDLKIDKDQLKNKKAWGDGEYDKITFTLSNSLMIGNGARVSRDILPYEIRVASKLDQIKKQEKNMDVKKIPAFVQIKIAQLEKKSKVYSEYEDILIHIHNELNTNEVGDTSLGDLHTRTSLQDVFYKVASSFDASFDINKIKDASFDIEDRGSISSSLVKKIIVFSREMEKKSLANYHAIVGTHLPEPPLYRYSKNKDHPLLGEAVFITDKTWEGEPVKITGHVIAVSEKEVRFAGVEGYHPAVFVSFDPDQKNVRGKGKVVSSESVTCLNKNEKHKNIQIKSTLSGESELTENDQENKLKP